MIAAIVLVLLLAVLVAMGLVLWMAEPQQHSEVELLRRRRQAERDVDREASRAKQALNDAANQSWRNLIE